MLRKALENQMEAKTNKDDRRKDVHELEEAKCSLETQLKEREQQMKELEKELQIAREDKLRMEMNLQAAKSQFDRDLAARDEQNEEKTRALLKQVKEILWMNLY